MDTSSFHEFKKQASLFFKEKIKRARLMLTDVTPSQLLTEAATNEDSLNPPDTPTMGLISRAAFEVDDYWRVMDVLHKRLCRFDWKNWRPSYKALILLEHLLTHGPERVAEEFECDKDVIREMTNSQHVDENGFNWGVSVRKKSESILKLIEDQPFLREERARARKLTHGIKGFGSFRLEESPQPHETLGRCNSHCNYCENQVDEERIVKKELALEVAKSAPKKAMGNPNTRLSNGEECLDEVKHPFCDQKDQTRASLLSSP